MTPAALRARQPYFWKNMALASALFGMSAGIYFYSLRAIQADDFEDVPIPPISDQELHKLQQEHEQAKQDSAKAVQEVSKK